MKKETEEVVVTYFKVLFRNYNNRTKEFLNKKKIYKDTKFSGWDSNQWYSNTSPDFSEYWMTKKYDTGYIFTTEFNVNGKRVQDTDVINN
jgi:hypothetical protein